LGSFEDLFGTALLIQSRSPAANVNKNIWPWPGRWLWVSREHHHGHE
jgi:hypothetical protein